MSLRKQAEKNTYICRLNFKHLYEVSIDWIWQNGTCD